MFDGDEMDSEVRWDMTRALGGLVGLAMCGGIVYRLWKWHSFSGAWRRYGDTVWRVIVGQTHYSSLHYHYQWKYGFVEVCPTGELAAGVVIVVALLFLLGAIFNRRILFFPAIGLMLSGCLLNAYLFCKLMATY